MIDRRSFVASGAASLLLPGWAVAQPESLEGPWTTGFVGSNGTIPILATMRLTVAGARAEMTDPLSRGFTGEARQAAGRVILTFPRRDGRPGGGTEFKGRFVSANRIEGVFRREDGFQTELAFLRGAALPATLPMPSLTQAGLEQTLADGGFPAMAAAVSTRAGGDRKWVAGVRKRGGQVSLTADDLWAIGSCTKAMTSTLAGRLVEQGAIRFDDTIGAVLGPGAPGMRADYRDLTLRHLLTHRAGLPRDLRDGDAIAMPRNESGPVLRQRAARTGLQYPPVAGAGQAAESYSNLGYAIAAAMMEARTGRGWDELMRREVFGPLGMASVRLEYDTTGADLTKAGLGVAIGEASAMQTLSNTFGAGYWKAAAPGGSSTWLTMADVVRFLRAHADHAAPYLKRETWDALQTDPFGGRYAMGWGVSPSGARNHTGSMGASYFTFQFNPRSGAVAAAAVNDGRDEAQTAVSGLLMRAISTTVTALPLAGSPEAQAATARARARN